MQTLTITMATTTRATVETTAMEDDLQSLILSPKPPLMQILTLITMATAIKVMGDMVQAMAMVKDLLSLIRSLKLHLTQMHVTIAMVTTTKAGGEVMAIKRGLRNLKHMAITTKAMAEDMEAFV